jgi:hypothetical protein
MKNVKAALKSLRYFDNLIIHGKRMVVGADYQDPCAHWGHEEVLAFVTTYCNDPTVREDAYIWTPWAVNHLTHISSCKHCLARVFSIPDQKLAEQGRVLLRAVS